MLERDTGQETHVISKRVPFCGFLIRSVAPIDKIIDTAKQNGHKPLTKEYLMCNTVRKTDWNPFVSPNSPEGATGFEHYFFGLPLTPGEVVNRIAKMGKQTLKTIVKETPHTGITAYAVNQALYEGRVTDVRTLIFLYGVYGNIQAKMRVIATQEGIIPPQGFWETVEKMYADKEPPEKIRTHIQGVKMDEQMYNANQTYQTKLAKALEREKLVYVSDAKDIYCQYTFPIAPKQIPGRISVSLGSFDKELQDGYRFMAQIGKTSHPIVIAALNHAKRYASPVCIE